MQNNSPNATRRSFFLTATAASAAAVSVTLVKSPSPVAIAEVLKPAPEGGGGYTLSEHVKQYYKTTLV